MEVLRARGTAADAAVAAAAVLTVVEPTGCGIGGDAFALHWDGETLHGLNASGRSPALLTPQDIPLDGWLPVTAPGQIEGWLALSDRFGRLPFEDLLEPAIRAARDGWDWTRGVAEGIVRAAERYGRARDAGTAGLDEWFRRYGQAALLHGAGSLVGRRGTSPEIAASLQDIATTRGETMRTGALAEAIDAASRADGGLLRLEDLAETRADWVDPIRADAFGATLHEIPPNGQGVAALMALEAFEESGGTLHEELEAMKAAFTALYCEVGEGSTLRRRRGFPAPPQASEPGPWHPLHGGTVCLAVGAPNGSMCSFIQSNYCGFGSGIIVPGTGISLQNRGAGFVNIEGHPNDVGPNKRPLHTIIPGFITRDGAPLCAFGWMGGPMEPQGHLQFMRRVLRDGEPIQDALDAARWNVAGGRRVWVEEGFDTTELEAHGHLVEVRDAIEFGGAQAVWRLPDGRYTGGSDLRKDGLLLLAEL